MFLRLTIIAQALKPGAKPGALLESFAPIDLPELNSLILSSKSSTCLLDPIPTKLCTIQSPQDFAGLFCDSCGLKLLISQGLFQQVAVKVAVFFRCLLRRSEEHTSELQS